MKQVADGPGSGNLPRQGGVPPVQGPPGSVNGSMFPGLYVPHTISSFVGFVLINGEKSVAIQMYYRPFKVYVSQKIDKSAYVWYHSTASAKVLNYNIFLF